MKKAIILSGGCLTRRRCRKADYLTSVKPGRFRISDVTNYRQSSKYSSVGSGIYASAGAGFSNFDSSSGLIGRRFDPPSYYLYRVEMKLDSADQPDVQTLICSKKWATRGNYYPTLAEIRGALGNIVELKAAGS